MSYVRPDHGTADATWQGVGTYTRPAYDAADADWSEPAREATLLSPTPLGPPGRIPQAMLAVPAPLGAPQIETADPGVQAGLYCPAPLGLPALTETNEGWFASLGAYASDATTYRTQSFSVKMTPAFTSNIFEGIVVSPPFMMSPPDSVSFWFKRQATGYGAGYSVSASLEFKTGETWNIVGYSGVDRPIGDLALSNWTKFTLQATHVYLDGSTQTEGTGLYRLRVFVSNNQPINAWIDDVSRWSLIQAQQTTPTMLADPSVVAARANEAIASYPSLLFTPYATGYPGSVDADLSAPSPLRKPRIRGFVDWTADLDLDLVQERFMLVVSAPAMDDITVPISSWQATANEGERSSFVQAVVPGVLEWVPALSARQGGTLRILMGYDIDGQGFRFEEIISGSFSEFRLDRGAQNATATLSGYTALGVSEDGHRDLRKVSGFSSQNGLRRVRCALDMFLRPGMTVTAPALGVSFRASYINYYVGRTGKICDVGERNG